MQHTETCIMQFNDILLQDKTKYDYHLHYAMKMLTLAENGGYDFEVCDAAITIHSKLPSTAYNCIFLRLPDFTAIDALIAQGSPFFLMDLTENIDDHCDVVLKSKGLFLLDEVTSHLQTNLKQFRKKPQRPFNTFLEPVLDEESLAIFNSIMGYCYGHDAQIGFDFFQKSLHNPHMEIYLLYEGRQPVACSMTTTLFEQPGLHKDAVLPKYRRRGYADYMLAHRCHELYHRGYLDCYALNLSSSHHYYRKNGFVPYSSVKMYLWSAQKEIGKPIRELDI